MLQNWVFMSAFLGFSLIGLFHDCILLFAPNRYLPSFSWGGTGLKLARKAPIQLGKRLAGLFLSAALIGIFMRPAILWMLHPIPSEISLGESPLSNGAPRWDLLVFTTVMLVMALILLRYPERSVEIMFAADKDKLKDKTTLRLWILYVQASAILIIIWLLLPAAEFIQSLHS